MKEKILLIVPTRNRDGKHFDLYQSVKDTSKNVDILFGLDEDDEHNYTRIKSPRVLYEVNPRIRMIPTLNLLAKKYASKYRYIAFMGDDHRPRTKSWDKTFIDKAKENKGVAICYGDDLIQRDQMCTAVFMTSNIIKKLGYMCPTSLIHLYADVFWKELGLACEVLFYFPEVIIEHMHFTVGKAEEDEIYSEVNSQQMFSEDGATYKAYKDSGELDKAAEKVKTLL